MFKQPRTGDEADTVIVRPSATTLFAISSTDRYKSWAQRRTNPTSPFSFIIQKNQALMNGYFRRLAMTEFRMNWTLPNIAQAWGNNILNISYILSSTTYTFQVILPDGFYGAEELALNLQGLFRSGGYALNSATFVAGIPNFIVNVTSETEDDQMYFIAPAGYTFWFTPIGSNDRELFDMLTLPSLTTPGLSSFQSGVPDLRATEYIDLVCSQLTNNMRQKDSTTAPNVRDVLARIYTDDSVPSQALVTTNYYNTTIGANVISAITALDGANYLFTIASPSSNYQLNEICYVTGVTGGANWNQQVSVTAIPSATTIEVYYGGLNNPSGTPGFTGSSKLIGTIGQLTQTSAPVTTWDDRVNGVTPFVLYRQFPVPKQIQWEHTQPIGNLRFEMYDSQGRSMSDLWNPHGNGTVIQPISASSTAGLLVTYTVLSTNGFNAGQNVDITGIAVATGYNAQATISKISNSTQLIVAYPAGTVLSGTPTYSSAIISTDTNFTGSFAWNASILCSED